MQATIIKFGLAFLLAIALVIGVDVLTNITVDLSIDMQVYEDMAENGILNNPNLRAPFAYRWVTPTLASLVMDLSDVNTYYAYKIVTYPALILFLWLSFVFTQSLRRAPRDGYLIMLVLAISLAHVKFLIFDPIRPDAWAYPLILLAFMAILNRRYILALLIALPGLWVREFLLIPAGAIAAIYLWDAVQNRDLRSLIYSIGVVLLATAFFMLPRLLIPVATSDEYIYIEGRSALAGFIQSALDWRRWLFILIEVAAYLLPVFLLFTPSRMRRIIPHLRPYAVPLVASVIVTLTLTIYGGTDIFRFVSYLFLVLITLLTFLLSQRIYPLEIVYMLIATAFFNRLFSDIPVSSDHAMVGFIGGIAGSQPLISWERPTMIAALIIVSLLLRAVLVKIDSPVTKS